MNPYQQAVPQQDTHSKVIGYLLWILVYRRSPLLLRQAGDRDDLVLHLWLAGDRLADRPFLIPAMDREADLRFTAGPIEYNVAWILLTFLGVFGVHRMYQGKWISGLLYLLTGGLFFIGVLYDFWTLNDQVSVRNAQSRGAF